MVPTRADRCCYVLHSVSRKRAADHQLTSKGEDPVSRKRAESKPLVKGYEKDLNMDLLDKAIDLLTDPIHGSPSKNQYVCGALCLHVDDLFMAGNSEFLERVVQALRRDFQVGSEDKNGIMFVGQRIRWTKDSKGYAYIRVDQDLCIDALEEITFEKRAQ